MDSTEIRADEQMVVGITHPTLTQQVLVGKRAFLQRSHFLVHGSEELDVVFSADANDCAIDGRKATMRHR